MEKNDLKYISTSERSIIDVLLYYDVFDHPLTFEELRNNSKWNSLGRDEFNKSLDRLVSAGLVNKKQSFYYINGKDWTVEARLSEQKRVARFMKIARYTSRIVASFPFVRGVFISGALSKERVEKKGDIDFFIITEAGKLWISRTLLVMFKKIFLFNSFKYFCLNYFIDEDTLEIPNKNRYTATDIVTLIPVYNTDAYRNFISANKWVYDYYPNYPERKPTFTVKPWSAPLKKFAEFILQNRMGKKLDNWLMQHTYKYRRKKFSAMHEQKFDKAFVTQKNVSTHHPNDFQDSVLERYHQNCNLFEQNHFRLINYPAAEQRGVK